MSEEARYVRLRPYDQRTGHLVRKFSLRDPELGFLKFNEAGVWHRVPLRVAEKLAEARQRPGNPQSPPVFDVCTEADARKLDAKAQAAREAVKAVVEPSVDTAKDMVGTPGRGDLSVEDVRHSRAKALASTAAPKPAEASVEPEVAEVAEVSAEAEADAGAESAPRAAKDSGAATGAKGASRPPTRRSRAKTGKGKGSRKTKSTKR
jgi:hypothetical protein